MGRFRRGSNGRARSAWRKTKRAVSELKRAAAPANGQTEYDAWCARSVEIFAEATAPESQVPPRIGILMAVHNPPLPFLREALASVGSQSVPDWELVVSDDGSDDPAVRRVLNEACQDPRVRLLRSERSQGIVGALNAALAAATAEYVGVLDHDDRLHPMAVELMLRHLAHSPDADLVYSDEDKIDEDGRHYDAYFKPDYSAELLLSSMYLNHFTVMRRSAVETAGSFRAGTDGAQDHDLALRMVRAGARISHQVGVLYHWRAWSGSTASGIQAKPWAQRAAAKVQAAHIEALGYPSGVVPSDVPGLNEVRLGIAGDPLVSVVIPTASKATDSGGTSPTLVEQCLRTLRPMGGLSNLEIVIVHTGPVSPRQQRVFDEFGALVVPYPETAFNFSTAINLGVQHSTGEYVLLLNDDTEIARVGSLHAMLEFAQLPEVGAVGARLTFPNGRNQHCGMLMVGGLPTHPFHGGDASHAGYFGSIITPRNYLAVTGAALMTRRSLFDRLGGLDPAWPRDYNDVDFCLRLHGIGKRVVYTPYAHLIHHEGASLVRSAADPGDTALFRLKWAGTFALDPFYSPLLHQELNALYAPL